MALEDILNDLKQQQQARRESIEKRQVQTQLPNISMQNMQPNKQLNKFTPYKQTQQFNQNAISPLSNTQSLSNTINNRQKVQPLSNTSNLSSQLSSLQSLSNNAQSSNANKSAIINNGLKFQGTKYTWGGNDLKKGVDCSGLTQQLFKQQGIDLPRTAAEQAKTGKAVSYKEAQPGDLLFFNTLDNEKLVDHVGIYMGNGQMLHASSGKKQVTTTNVNDKYWQSRLTGVRRN
jgi:cell wall-associated NlpC family hydrolase